MAYTPKTAKEILQDLVAGVVARSELTDIAEGSVIAQILSTVATELSSSEYRLARIRDSFSLQRVSGSLLDERIQEFPAGSLSRLPPSAARGNVLSISRVEESAGEGLPNEAIIPVGSTIGRTDDASVLYALTEAVTFASAPNDASQTVKNISVVCLVPGIKGNCRSGSIDKIVSMPSFVSSIEQTSPILGGQEQESDAGLRSRALLHLGSLARCQPGALEHFALSFTASDRTRARYAAIYEDRHRRGYSELVVDDGSIIVEGEDAALRPGRTIEGTVPGSGEGILTIFHEAPAFRPIRKIQRFDSDGNESVILPDVFVSLPERGMVYVDGGVFDAGDTYRIGPIQNDDNAGYEVFTGSLIPELQRAIEGDLSDPVGNPGLRAAGTRVRVLPPRIQVIGFDMQLIPVSGASFVDTADEIKEAAVEFVLTLRPGDTLFVSQLVDRVMDNPNIIDVKFFEHDVVNPGTTVMQDRIPQDSRNVLRPDPTQILVIPPEDTE